MTAYQGLFAAVSAIVLFLYGLQGFSRELQTVGGAALQSWLGRMTAIRWGGFIIGAAATAIVQSSSAITALAVALVDSGVISFQASLGILLGANVGTTATAWLVSFKLTGIGPLFIVLGAILSAVPVRLRIIGKAVFYFGLIFFALDLISAELKPLQDRPAFREWLALAEIPWKGVLAGIFFTALVQSSSVTTGLSILLVQQGILPPQSGDTHCHWRQRRLDIDSLDRQRRHEARRPSDRHQQFRLQFCRDVDLPAVSGTVLAGHSGLERRSRHGRRLGTPHL